jgi:hypothetical protein
MNITYKIQSDEEGNMYRQICDLLEQQPWTWQSVSAVIGLMGAVLCPLLGILLTVATWFIVSPKAISVFHIVSVAAFALTVPLLACGAHCLDLIEKKIPHRSVYNKRPSHEAVPLNASAHRGG